MTCDHLRIAYMTGEYPRATDTFIQREVAALRELGVHIETIAVRRPKLRESVGEEQERELRRTAYLLPCSPWRLLGRHVRLAVEAPLRYLRALRLAVKARSPGVRAFLYQLFYFAEAALVVDLMRRNRVRHLHNHFANSSCSVAMIAAELGGFTYSFTVHGPAIFYEPARWRLDEKVRRALFVCCISHFCRSQTMLFSPPEAWDRLHIIHCGVEPELYPVVEHAGRGRRLLYVGRLARIKGLAVLLETFRAILARSPDLVLEVVGDGPDRAALEALARGLGIERNVEFRGYLSQEAVRERLREAAAFVLPSFAEGVPVVLMEALAAGVPVVATRVAGVAELVEDGVSGFLVPPGDPGSLCERIEELLADPDLRTRMGRAGRAKVCRDFDIRREAARLRDILLGALGRSTSPASGEPPSRDALSSSGASSRGFAASPDR